MKSSLNYMTSFGEAGEERKTGEREEEDSNIPVSFSYLSICFEWLLETGSHYAALVILEFTI